jgi:predicted secreted protein
VSLAANGTLIVALVSNPSTGYSWYVVSPEPAHLELDGEPKYIPPGSTSPVVGAAGTQVFTFKATGSGTSTLLMEYRRITTPPEPAAETFTVTVETR